ncbi:MAG: SDR family NAD(P)-dependent oxidoreductase [Betaproteobacteria bacterium]|nr:SDR family NAD(P)-dependent oxidoreductase [Betaproteobacteria bacterium]
MKNLKGKVAVVTGSAAGIGLAMAERFAKEGMKVVLSDVNASMLDTQVKRLRLNGFDVCGFVTDVSSAHSVAQLAEHVISQYGKVHCFATMQVLEGVLLTIKPCGKSVLKIGNGSWISISGALFMAYVALSLCYLMERALISSILLPRRD